MPSSREQLWKVEATVEPEVEWEKIGIGSFKIGRGEVIAFEKQLENKTQLSVTIISDRAEVYNKAQLVMKSFLALLDLEPQRGYRPTISSARPVPTEHGHGLVGSVLFGHFKVIPRFEDLDLSLLKTLGSSLEGLGTTERDRVLGALNFLYDALAASTEVQSYLSIYAGLNFLTSGVGQQTNTLLSDAMTLFAFIDSGILDAGTAKGWIEKFRTFHSSHYNVLKSNRVNKQELDEIKTFFKEFLMKYLEYGKVRM